MKIYDTLMKLLEVDLPTAIKVEEYMVISFSNCTKAQFNREARDSLELIKLLEEA